MALADSVWYLKLKYGLVTLVQLAGFALVALGVWGMWQTYQRGSIFFVDKFVREAMFGEAALPSIIMLAVGLIIVWASTSTRRIG